MNSDTSPASTSTPPWRRPEWSHSTIEARPESAPNWPQTAVERVTFTAENTTLPKGLSLPPEALPLTVYFDESGWPVGTPAWVRDEAKDAFFTLRAGLHAWPWYARLVNADAEAWRRELTAIQRAVFRKSVAWQADLLRRLNGALPSSSNSDEGEP